jgi:hypothetical protein
MKTTRLPEPERWTDRPDARSSTEDLLGVALRRARAATAPSEALCARLETGPEREVLAIGGRHRWLVATAALGAILAVGGSVGAVRRPLRAWAERHRFVAAPPAAPPEAPRRARHVAEAQLPETEPIEAPAALAQALVAEGAPVRQPAPMAAPRPAPVEAPAPVAAERPEAEEARALDRVFRALRAEGRADVAIAALDDYDRRFPSGLLRREARLARVEALLARGARGEALALLDVLDAEGGALPRSARAARGELRADAGRCAEAASDFEAVLASSSEDEAAGRALYGQAACALRAGDAATAVASLTRYLEKHPEGPRAAAARAALSRVETP